MIACLLPIRNAEAEIGDWLQSAGAFADVILALDESGSTRIAPPRSFVPCRPSQRCCRTTKGLERRMG